MKPAEKCRRCGQPSRELDVAGVGRMHWICEVERLAAGLDELTLKVDELLPPPPAKGELPEAVLAVINACEQTEHEACAPPYWSCCDACLRRGLIAYAVAYPGTPDPDQVVVLALLRECLTILGNADARLHGLQAGGKIPTPDDTRGRILELLPRLRAVLD